MTYSVSSHSSDSATHTDKLLHYQDGPRRARLEATKTKLAEVHGFEPR